MKVLMKGNEALAEAAIRGGCTHFFGYPITPQNEIPSYMAKALPKKGGVFLQAESEVSAINMVYGAAGAGARVMTSSSSPGISLKLEGISYIAGADLPCVIVNMMRGGPGLGSIQPSQADYFQAVKGGGHGDYKLLTYAPDSVQEMADLTKLAFDNADKYRTPVMILGDGLLGQMMEPVELPEENASAIDRPWATTGTQCKRAKNYINSLYLNPGELEGAIKERFERYDLINKHELKYEEIDTDGADIVIVAYGITARIAMSAMRTAQDRGMKVGLIRPITLWPFPKEVIGNCNAGKILAVEMSMGQMVEDVKLSLSPDKELYFYGRAGGYVPSDDELVEKLEKVLSGGDKQWR